MLREKFAHVVTSSVKNRNITKVISPSFSTVNLETSDACSLAPNIIQTSSCTSLSTSPIDITIKSLDPTSIELVDDTAHDATSSTIVGETLKDTHSAGSADDPTYICKSSLSESYSAK